MKKYYVLFVIFLIILSSLLSSCVQEDEFACKFYGNPIPYSQIGEETSQRNKQYQSVSLKDTAVLNADNLKIYNDAKQPAVDIQEKSVIFLLNSEVFSKDTGIKIKGDKSKGDFISSTITSCFDYTIDLADEAKFVGSSLTISNINKSGIAINVNSKAAMILNNSSIHSEGTAVYSSSIAGISNVSVDASNLILTNGARMTINESSLNTVYGIQIKPSGKVWMNEDVIMDINSSSLYASNAPLVTVSDNTAAITFNMLNTAVDNKKSISLIDSKVILSIQNTELFGDVNIDDKSELYLILKNKSVLNAAIKNKSAESRTSINIESGSLWKLTQDSYISGLTLEGDNLSLIESNGFDVYYNPTHTGNTWLESKTVMLSGGGRLIPSE